MNDLQLRSQLSLRECDAVFRDAAENMSMVAPKLRFLPGSKMKGKFFSPDGPLRPDPDPPDLSIGRLWMLSMGMTLSMQMDVRDQSDHRLINIGLTSKGTDTTLQRMGDAFKARDPDLVVVRGL